MSWTKIETVEQALELLEKAVATRGSDFVYQKPEGEDFCKYVKDDKPDCLIGVVLSMCGWTNEELKAADGVGSVDAISVDERWADRFGNNAVRVLVAAQTLQDNGNTWGSALASARRCAASLKFEA